MTALPQRLAGLVVKSRVSIGLLDAADRDHVLALAGTPLDAGRAYREADVNTLLKRWLEGPGAMLGADHVELRRWLVDLGFVARDGFGREYRRSADEVARAESVLGAASREALEAAIENLRAERAAQRDARRRAHAATS